MNTFCKQLSELLPEKVALHGYAIHDFQLLFPELKVSSVREQELIVGRYCAGIALRKFDIIGCEVGQNFDGSPVWPSGMIGSITHSKGWVLAVVARSEDFQSIGIDLEKMNRLKVTSIQRIVHDLEVESVGDDSRRATILFALKEAFYKTQSPIFKGQLNFRDLALSVDFENNSASLIWVSSKVAIDKSLYKKWKFAFTLVEDYVFVFCLFENI